MTKILRGLRGATTATANTSDAILAATAELLRALQQANGFAPDDIESAIFTSSPDLTADYPARAARLLGWTSVPFLPFVRQPTPTPHRSKPGGRLQFPDQHGAGRAFRLADKVQAPVDAVGPVDIGVPRRPEHHRIARRDPAKGVARGIPRAAVSLDLDDASGDARGRELADEHAKKAITEGSTDTSGLPKALKKALPHSKSAMKCAYGEKLKCNAQKAWQKLP